VKEKFDALGTREELLHRTGLDAQGIAEAVLGLLFDKEKNQIYSRQGAKIAENIKVR
jgi:hypothetical protein